MSEVLWSPPDPASTNWSRFAGFVGVAADQLHPWSVDNVEDFWSALWDFAGVVGHKGDRVFVPGEHFWQARFFPDAKLNVAENLLRDGAEVALICRGEDRACDRELTRTQLRALVAKAAAAMRDLGIGPGDRVAAWLPNIGETYVVMLAA
ncbi:MAG: AMP-binding protein, partial [Acidimicrobiales bacterium]|nr:AMP-binding protein [Acidimicrobiales bacterium]